MTLAGGTYCITHLLLFFYWKIHSSSNLYRSICILDVSPLKLFWSVCTVDKMVSGLMLSHQCQHRNTKILLGGNNKSCGHTKGIWQLLCGVSKPTFSKYSASEKSILMLDIVFTVSQVKLYILHQEKCCCRQVKAVMETIIKGPILYPFLIFTFY